MTVVTSASDIREKAGIAIRDILKGDATVITLLELSGNRTIDDCVHYSAVGQKARFEKTYPYIRVDKLPDDLGDYSQDGSMQEGLYPLKITCFDWDSMRAHKLADAAFKAVQGAQTTLLGQGLCLNSTSSSTFDEVMSDGKTLTNDGITLSFTYMGSRS